MQTAPAATLHAASWHTFEAGGLALRYLTVGDGADIWLVFHGYGQRVEAMATALEPLAEQGRLLIVELPAHGSSPAPADFAPITLTAWERFITALLKREQVNNLNVVGYSIGGRLALATAYLLRSRVEQLVLIAAEGCAPSFWYSLATGTVLGRRLLVSLVGKPGWLLALIRGACRASLLPRPLARFALAGLSSQPRRKRMAATWLALRDLPPALHTLAAELVEHATPVRLFAGRHDSIAPLRRMRPLARYLTRVQVHLLDAGHGKLPALAAKVLIALHKR